ncbi:MAG: hypothetical protein JSS02_18325 [Planctomycetes bacterium]|nr:hypothetical protein [Planctomycetota bacterium]
MSGSLSTSASRPRVKHASESLLFGVDFTKLLTAGELLTGTPAVVLTGVSNPAGSALVPGNTVPPLVVGNGIVNPGPFANDEGGMVQTGAGVQFRLSGGVSPADYRLTVTSSTTTGNVRTVVCVLQVRDS